MCVCLCGSLVVSKIKSLHQERLAIEDKKVPHLKP